MFKFMTALAVASAEMDMRTTNIQPWMGRCIGCSDAVNGQIPWQTSCQTSTGWHFCGGSVISANYISTAAHCKQNGNFYVNVGDVDRRNGQRIMTSSFTGHPNYNSRLIINDFAVAKLSSSISMNDNVKPIQLVAPSTTRYAHGHPMLTSGFGYYQYGSNGRPIQDTSMYLKYSDIKHVGQAECKAVWTGQTIDNSVICADNDNMSICSGDSGGPLVVQEDGEWKLIGLTSWAHVYCSSAGLPQGWANVQYPDFNSWMKTNAELNY